jgi:hypothetical protein
LSAADIAEIVTVGFGELKVEQAEIRGLDSGAHRAGDPLVGVERKAYSQRHNRQVTNDDIAYLRLGNLSETVVVHGNAPHDRPRFLMCHRISNRASFLCKKWPDRVNRTRRLDAGPGSTADGAQRHANFPLGLSAPIQPSRLDDCRL